VSDRVVIEPLAQTHDRSGFSCGVPALDRYFQEYVTQDVRRRLANCFVAIDEGSTAIVGYYTFSAASIHALDLPPEETRRVPRYPMLPAGLIGRLAVDVRFRGRHLGAALVADALQRAMRADPTIFALLVEAKDDNAQAFYGALGFRPLASAPMSLFISIATARRAFSPAIK
jgi:ribosomal protein S18 acetylase RimI-like enzyme